MAGLEEEHLAKRRRCADDGPLGAATGEVEAAQQPQPAASLGHASNQLELLQAQLAATEALYSAYKVQ